MKYLLSIVSMAAIIGASIYLLDNQDETPKIASTKTKEVKEEILEQEQLQLDSMIQDADSEDKAENETLNTEVKNELAEVTPVKSTPKSIKKKIVKTKVKTIKKTAKVEDKVETKQAALSTTETNLDNRTLDISGGKFSQIIDMSMTTDTKETTNDEKGYESKIAYILGYKINSDYSLRFKVAVGKDLATSYEEQLSDTSLTFSKSAIKLTDKLSYAPSLTAIVPTSESSKRNQDMIMGIQLGNGFSYALTDLVSLSYAPNFVKYFHEYETSRTNRLNTEYRFVQSGGLGYSITDKISAGLSMSYVNSWSYKGTRRNPSYMTITSLGYQATSNMSLAIGTLQGGSLVNRERGSDSTIELYDENDTTFYGNLTLSF